MEKLGSIQDPLHIHFIFVIKSNLLFFPSDNIDIKLLMRSSIVILRSIIVKL
jgi:hypothetical protein